MGREFGNKRACWRRFRGNALGTVSIIPFLVMGVGKALAQPVGASVIAGQAQVSSLGATTVINQSTAKAIINWQDFSVGQGAAVQFNQPNAASVTLNRVTGSAVSTIDGAIRANGQVWLLNPNGLLFGNNATINVGGLLATTSDIANQDFLDSRYNFTGGRNAIVNNGTIKAGDGGSVVLSAPSVTNRGLIQARAGHVVLGGTDTFTVDFNGDHLLSYAVGANSTGGKVSNSGTIQAQGGKVLLTARAASGVQDAVVNNTGMVEATSVREENGEIILEADNGGVANSGTLDASGKGAGETGGTVKVLGQQVAVEDGAKIDVSGDAGGGTALIGGNFHGQGGEVHAQNSTVGKAVIKADAITSGNGGKVAVWSDGNTKFAGAISARGGAQSGDGGQVETSGHTLDITGASVDAGVGGSWLLDPYDLTVDSSAAASINTTLGNSSSVLLQTTATGTSGPGTPNASGNGDIFINAPISWSTGASLGLYAYRNIQFNANVTVTGAGTLTINTGMGASGVPGSSPGDYSFAAGSRVTFTSQASNPVLSINSSVYTLLYGMSGVQAINTDSTSLGVRYALAASLDATSVSTWTTIGTDGAGNPNNFGNGFTGVFTGLGNTISNLSINQPTNSYVGLFGYSSGTIRDVGMVGGTITGNYAVGGLVGKNAGTGAISNAYATPAVSGSNLYVGGLAGINYGTITNSYATGAVSNSSDETGGLVGINLGTVSASFASGAVSGNNDAGGLVGQNNGGTITNAYAAGAVSAGSNNAGGLVGFFFNSGTISNVYATGAVTGSGAVNGLIGSRSVGLSVTNGYWDTDNTAADNSGSGATGLTTAQLSGALPTGFSASTWANVGNQTTPYLIANQAGSVLIGSVNNIPYSLIFTMPQLQAVNNNLFNSYALANSLDASSTTNFVPLGVDASGNVQGSGLGFPDFFDGLGHTINNLTINTSNQYAGLFGYTGGIISNLGVVGGSVTGTGYVGGLAGQNNGTINNSYSTASVHATGSYVGGLVGYNTNAINQSFATGAVTANASSQQFDVGGLVGVNVPTGPNIGTISQSYATGAVTVSGTYDGAGGLVGQNINGSSTSNIIQSYATGAVTAGTGTVHVGGLAGWSNGAILDDYATGAVSGGNNTGVGGLVGLLVTNGTITTSYATGAVSGGSSAVGGLVGTNQGGTIISAAYWDTNTSGQSSGSDGTGQTTVQLQGSPPISFSASTWGTGAGLYPYLLWRYPSTPQAVSGVAYSDAGVTPLVSTASGAVTVSALIGGTKSGSSTTGANGYYYILEPAGTFSGTQQLLTYLDGNAIHSNTYIQNASGNISGADLFGNTLQINSAGSTTSSMFTGLAAAVGTNSGANFLYSGGNIVSGTNLNISAASSNGFTVDQAINTGGGNLTLTAPGGAITQSAGITSQDLNASSGGAITLDDSRNTVNGTARFTTTGGDVTFVNSLPVVLGASSVTGTLSVTANLLDIEVGDTNGGAVSATVGVNLTAPNFITQDLGGAEIPIQTPDLTATITGTGAGTNISLMDSSFGGPANAITNSVTFNPGSANTAISFFNTATTTLGAIGPVASLKVVVADLVNGLPVGINLNPGAGQMIQASGTVTLDASGDIQVLNFAGGGDGIQAPNISLTSHGGSIGFSGLEIAVSAPSGPLLLSVANNGSTGNAYLTSTSAVSVVGVSLSGGTIDLRTAGDLTVNSAIATSGVNSLVVLESQGSLILHANVTDTDGAVFLGANSNGALNSSASISGTGTVSAADVGIQLVGINDTGTGSIGTSVGSPLLLGLATSGSATALGLEVSTGGQSVFLSSQASVNISTSGDGSPIPMTGVNLSGASTFGDFNLTAAGQITQDSPITANNLTVSTTGSGHSIVLSGDNIGSSGSGVAVFNTALGSDVSYDNQNAVVLGDSNVGGNFTATAGAGSLTIAGATISQAAITFTSQAGIFSTTSPGSYPVRGVSVRLDGGNQGNTAPVGSNQVGNSGSPLEIITNSLAVSSGETSDMYLNVKPLGGGTVTIANLGVGSPGLYAGVPGPNQGSVHLNVFDSHLAETGVISAALITIGTQCTTSCPGLDISLTGNNQVTNRAVFSIFGTGNVSYTNTMDTTLGAMTIGGNLAVVVNDFNESNSPNFNPSGHAYIAIQGGIIQVNGTGNSSLHASGEIRNADPSGDQIASANGLSLISDNGNIGSLTGLIDVEVTNLHAKTGGGDIFLNAANPFNIYDGGLGGGGIDAGTGAVNLFQVSQNGGQILQSAGLSGAIRAGNLKVNTSAGLGDVNLQDSANQVSGTVTFDSAGAALFADAVSLTLGNIATANGGKIKVVTGGDLTITSGAVLSSSQTSGYSIQLSAAGHFINHAGANTLSIPSGGNFAIFSAGPAGDVFGNLNSGNTAIWGTVFSSGNGPPPFNVTGNRYVFAQQATLTVSANSASKVYGVNDAAGLQNGYVITGLQPGVANAFLADTAAVYSGTPAVTTTGAAASASVGSYVIAAGAGSFAATNGYTVAFQNNTLTVTPATLAYAVNAAARTYGAANPAFGGGVNGFVNGDTLASATSGTLTFATAATVASPIGVYAVNGSGLSAANYIFTQAAGNASALTITPATLLYAANAAARTYGAANPAFGGGVNGFVNDDTLASATSGTLVFATAATAASPIGVYAVNGSGLSAANYILAQAAGNASALTINPAILLYAANAAARSVGDPNPIFSGSINGFVNGDSQTSATSGTLVFATPATATSPVGSYAINGSGLSAANYVFAQAPANATALTINPAATTTVIPPDTATVLTGFTASIQPPPLNSPLNSPLNNSQPGGSAPPPAPAPPPPPPPGGSPLAANNTTDDGQPAETPNSSDQTTGQVADSLDGGAPPAGAGGGGPVIPKMLVNAPPPSPPPTDISALPSFGNSALWQ